MSELFARLYLDEDVSVVVAARVRSRGYEVMTAQQVGNLQLSDAAQLAYASDHGMVIVTHNRRDFDRLAAEYIATKRSHAGIIASVRRPEPQIAARLLQILDQYSADELRDLLLYI